MPQDDPTSFDPTSLSREQLAHQAVSLVKSRQARTEQGARQFVIDHLLRSVLSRGHFCPDSMLDELRGYRLSLDSVIDLYVPIVAREMGLMWQNDEADFATVTIGTMRLQALLSLASVEEPEGLNFSGQNKRMLVIVPPGEQHSLGAFVLSAQLRRLGARVELSFCEPPEELISRILATPPDMALFSVAGRATLETVSQVVLKVKKVLAAPPLFALGGYLPVTNEEARDISGVDLVTMKADKALALANRGRPDTHEVHET